jgi:hypothetical protein
MVNFDRGWNINTGYSNTPNLIENLIENLIDHLDFAEHSNVSAIIYRNWIWTRIGLIPG